MSVHVSVLKKGIDLLLLNPYIGHKNIYKYDIYWYWWRRWKTNALVECVLYMYCPHIHWKRHQRKKFLIISKCVSLYKVCSALPQNLFFDKAVLKLLFTTPTRSITWGLASDNKVNQCEISYPMWLAKAIFQTSSTSRKKKLFWIYFFLLQSAIRILINNKMWYYYSHFTYI